MERLRKDYSEKRLPGRAAALLLAVTLLAALSGAARAESRRLTLPDGKHSLLIPGDMEEQKPSASETNLKGIYLLPPDLEMLVFAYDAGGLSVQDTAEALVSSGRKAEVRKIAGTEFLVFQDMDETDGATCVGYGYISGGQMTEISFFCATQEAMDLTQTIMESFHE